MGGVGGWVGKEGKRDPKQILKERNNDLMVFKEEEGFFSLNIFSSNYFKSSERLKD